MPDLEPQSLNTYTYYRCLIHTSDVRYKNLRIVVTFAAGRELMKEEKTIPDIINMLERGYDAPRKRQAGTIEKWFNKGKKTYNIVIVKDHHFTLNEDVWTLIHFGKFTRRKLK